MTSRCAPEYTTESAFQPAVTAERRRAFLLCLFPYTSQRGGGRERILDFKDELERAALYFLLSFVAANQARPAIDQADGFCAFVFGLMLR